MFCTITRVPKKCMLNNFSFFSSISFFGWELFASKYYMCLKELNLFMICWQGLLWNTKTHIHNICYNHCQNIVGIFKSVFNVPPLPLYSVANPRHRLTQPLRIVSTFSMVRLFFWVNPMEIFSMTDHFWKKILLSTVDRG